MRLAALPLLEDGKVSRPLLFAAAAVITLLYALLWSPWWYPLSDSSLYLIMARNLASGKGLASLSMVHRSVRPLTPMLLWVITKIGGGIGAMHVVMIGLMLLSHTLCFLTLRRWFNERVALAATFATAISWWVFSNSFSVMTEPMFLLMWWACVWTLSQIPSAPPRRRTLLVIIAALCLAGAWGNRMAAALLLPGVLVGIWFGYSGVAPARARLLWAGIFLAVFAVLIAVYLHKTQAGTGETGGLVSDVGDSDRRAAQETYKWTVLIGVSSPLLQLPVMGGRWVLESLAAAFAVPFNMKPGTFKSTCILVSASVGAVLIFLLTVVGWVRLLRQRQWWAAAVILYFLPFWFMWGTRVKPRYMVPIIPLLFIMLWQGAAIAFSMPWVRKLGRPLAFARASRAVVWVLLVGSVLLNALPWGIEFYLRHVTPHNFYDQARRGGFAELVDIGAYLKEHAVPSEIVWTNRGAYRRIIGFLADHDPKTIRGDVTVQNTADTARLRKYFERAKAGNGQWAIVFYESTPWPTFHWPLPTTDEINRSPRWWQLYHRDASDQFVLVPVPRSAKPVEVISATH